MVKWRGPLRCAELPCHRSTQSTHHLQQPSLTDPSNLNDTLSLQVSFVGPTEGRRPLAPQGGVEALVLGAAVRCRHHLRPPAASTSGGAHCKMLAPGVWCVRGPQRRSSPTSHGVKLCVCNLSTHMFLKHSMEHHSSCCRRARS